MISSWKKTLAGAGMTVLSALLITMPVTVFADENEENRFCGETEYVQEIRQIVKEGENPDDGVVQFNLEDEVAFMGALPADELPQTEANERKVEQVNQCLAVAIENREGSVDISKYDISVEDADTITAALLNDNPQFFYLSDVAASYNKDTNTVDDLYLSYNAAQTNSDTYETVVAQILSGVKSDWSDEQKILYIHDYLVTHCVYDYSFSKYSAYNALVEGTAVCQGYSLAFYDLIGRLGINVIMVSSRELNHAWNAVEINNKMYYIDCTWDDPNFYEHVYQNHQK